MGSFNLFMLLFNEIIKEEVVEGICFVFNLIDILESMCVLSFEVEEDVYEYIS